MIWNSKLVRGVLVGLFLLLGGHIAEAEPPATVAYIKCVIDELQPNQEGLGLNVPYEVRGSGVLVWSEAADGSLTIQLLTAKHVGQRGSRCYASLREGYAPDLQLIRVNGQSSDLDAMVFRFAANLGDSYRPASFKVPTQGMDIRAWGVPDGSVGNQIEVRSGIISANVPDEHGFLGTDALSARGMSGGPVFDQESGALIGIIAGAAIDQLGLVTSYKVLSVGEIARDFDLIPLSTATPNREVEPSMSIVPPVARGWLNKRKAIRTQLGPDGNCSSSCDDWAGVPWELTIGASELIDGERISSVECKCLSDQLCWFDENGPRGSHQSIVGTDGKNASCFITARTHPTRWILTANVQEQGDIRGWVYVGQFLDGAWTDPQFTELGTTPPGSLSGQVVTSFGNNLREASSVEAKVLTQVAFGAKLEIDQTNMDSAGYVWAKADILGDAS